MTFAENLNRICREQGTYLSHVLKGLGFSTSKVTAINKGQIPNNETDLLNIAHALNCSVMDFFADEEDLREPPQEEAQDGDESDILRVFRSLSRREKHDFMSMVYDFEEKYVK